MRTSPAPSHPGPAGSGERGFTLIELLVVILIIAILAAIAIPVFLAQREKGWVAQSQSVLKNGATAAESYATENGGSYLGLTQAALVAQGWNPPAYILVAPGRVRVFFSSDGSMYCLQVRHANQRRTHPWRTSSYRSWEGSPTSANSCSFP